MYVSVRKPYYPTSPRQAGIFPPAPILQHLFLALFSLLFSPICVYLDFNLIFPIIFTFLSFSSTLPPFSLAPCSRPPFHIFSQVRGRYFLQCCGSEITFYPDPALALVSGPACLKVFFKFYIFLQRCYFEKFYVDRRSQTDRYEPVISLEICSDFPDHTVVDMSV